MKAIIIIIIVALISHDASAQQYQIQPVCTLNSAGTGAMLNSINFEHSIGEMVLVHTANTNSTMLTQGYLQPGGKIEPAKPEVLPVPNNVLTPNGDGKNDRFVVPEIEQLPNNRLSIFDRAGREIFKASPYRNEWNGMLNGKILAEDTYYYIFLPAENYAPVRGFISIIHNK